jgi:phosphodiesterase/alkaline phosphatase D-like protein
MAHLGDTSYVDTWDEYLQDTDAHTYTKFAAGLRAHFRQSDLANLYSRVPVRMVMDDHDSGPDNSYETDVYPQARQAFSDIAAGTSFDNRLYAAIEPMAPTYDTWMSGCAQFWLLDNRLWRDAPNQQLQSFAGQKYASQLGASQRAWLKASLAASSAPIKIILSPRTFTQFYTGPEQQELIDWITGYRSRTPMVSGTVVFLTGDMHAGAVWRLSPTRPVFEMLCGPMNNTTLHSPQALASWQVKWGYQTRFLNTSDGLPGRAVSNAWGRVDIGADNSVALNLMKDDGTLLYQELIAG